MEFDRVSQFVCHMMQRFWFPGANVVGPVLPGNAAEMFLKRHEERELAQPGCLGHLEIAELDSKLRGALLLERLERPAQRGSFVGGRRAVINLVFAESTGITAGIESEKTQSFDRNQQRISGERRKSRVRRITVPGRRERHELPVLLTAKREPVDELIC